MTATIISVNFRPATKYADDSEILSLYNNIMNIQKKVLQGKITKRKTATIYQFPVPNQNMVQNRSVK